MGNRGAHALSKGSADGRLWQWGPTRPGDGDTPLPHTEELKAVLLREGGAQAPRHLTGASCRSV